ncbi:thioredoxin family protein [Pararhodonellum marinum]|uniref:thioredoxin family protein n=1 Tax=Pararhodonellum marinum TaxID=2755358 RepID=UPI00188F508D|nr:thioredoxin family protein [Pararhodonellum marinum]
MKNSKGFYFSIVLSGLFALSAMAQESTGYKVGDKAADFSLKDVRGEMVSLSNYEDAKGFLVIFSCNTCPYVVAYEDRMIELHEKYAEKGYPVIAINSNDDKVSPGDSFEKMQERAKAKNFPFPYVYDKSQEVIKTYGATRTPHVYILNKSGEDYVVEYIGAIDNNYQVPSAVTEPYVEKALAELMDGKKVSRNSTKAIGCTIKWTR